MCVYISSKVIRYNEIYNYGIVSESFMRLFRSVFIVHFTAVVDEGLQFDLNCDSFKKYNNLPNLGHVRYLSKYR